MSREEWALRAGVVAIAVGAVGMGPVKGPGVASGIEELPRAYADGPPPGHTGGFGEPTCRSCHFDNELARDTGSLRVTGFPDRFRPGETYRLTVALARPGMERAGFQLAVRRESGPGRGRSAGTLEVSSDRVQLVGGEEAPDVVYAEHTRSGSRLSSIAVDSATWTVEWVAPDRCGGVVLHASANAANGDDSEFGDHVYALEVTVRPGGCREGGGAGGGGGSAG